MHEKSIFDWIIVHTYLFMTVLEHECLYAFSVFTECVDLSSRPISRVVPRR